MKIVFLGTPDFGVQILNALVKVHDVVLVVTQPDSKVGRKQEIVFPPVKKRALELGLDVFQPASIRAEYEYIQAHYDYDLIVSAAYGQIVGMKFINSAKYRAINVHASLLPIGRGGAPIQRAIINGDKETGISIIYMEKGMDTGAILAQESIPIEDSDTKETLFNKLGDLGAKMINNTIDDLVNGKIKPIKQDEAKATYTYALTKEDEIIDFNKSAFLVNALVRGLGDIGATFSINGENFKVYKMEVLEDVSKNPPKTIEEVSKKYFTIVCGDQKLIKIDELKPAGKNLMKVNDFLNGRGKNILIKGKKVD